MAWRTSASSENLIETVEYRKEYRWQGYFVGLAGAFQRESRTTTTTTRKYTGIREDVANTVAADLAGDGSVVGISVEDIGGGGRNVTQVSESSTGWKVVL